MLPLLGIAGSALTTAATAAYIVHIATASTAQKKREELLGHAKNDVLGKLMEVDRAPDQTKVDSINADITLLQQRVKTGWNSVEEQQAAMRILNFIFSAHVGETAHGVGRLTEDIGKNVGKTFDEFSDSASKKLDEIGADISKKFDDWLNLLKTPSDDQKKDDDQDKAA